MINDLEGIGIGAVSGAPGINYFAFFSCVYFLESWLSGFNFEQSVENAFKLEIEKLNSYKANIPLIEQILTEEVKNDSKQSVGGVLPNLLWQNKSLKSLNI